MKADVVVAPDDGRSALARLATRAFWLAAGATAWFVVVASAWLRPDPRGFGTHQQLGLPPCMFEAYAHFPCPGCGLTTSFAHMAHGHVVDAFGAHLMGPFLFALTLAVAVASPWALRRALPVAVVLAHPAATPVLSVTLAAGMITLAGRIVRHYAG